MKFLGLSQKNTHNALSEERYVATETFYFNFKFADKSEEELKYRNLLACYKHLNIYL